MADVRATPAFRVRFGVLGAHVHCGLYVADGSGYAKCGEFVVRRGLEFVGLTRAFAGAEFVPESEAAAAAAVTP